MRARQQESSILLHRGSECALRESNGCARVTGGEVGDFGRIFHKGSWRAWRKRGDAMCPRSAGFSSKYSAPASRAARSKAALARVLRQDTVEAADVFAVAHRWGFAVGDVGVEEAADGEGRAGRSRDDCGVSPGHATLQQSRVHGVQGQVKPTTAAVLGVVVEELCL
eukprot:6199145-Pleurochrysis_carterae.AAC.1